MHERLLTIALKATARLRANPASAAERRLLYPPDAL
jgi:hypothetical protein